MSVSMRVMSAGNGYKYLLRTVAAADGDRPLSTSLTRYYAEAGTPPGRWLGSGLASLGHGEITGGALVSEARRPTTECPGILLQCLVRPVWIDAEQRTVVGNHLGDGRHFAGRKRGRPSATSDREHHRAGEQSV